MNKKIIDYGFWVEIATMPIMYIIAILKILIFIPIWIIAKINGFMSTLG